MEAQDSKITCVMCGGRFLPKYPGHDICCDETAEIAKTEVKIWE